MTNWSAFLINAQIWKLLDISVLFDLFNGLTFQPGTGINSDQVWLAVRTHLSNRPNRVWSSGSIQFETDSGIQNYISREATRFCYEIQLNHWKVWGNLFYTEGANLLQWIKSGLLLVLWRLVITYGLDICCTVFYEDISFYRTSSNGIQVCRN